MTLSILPGARVRAAAGLVGAVERVEPQNGDGHGADGPGYLLVARLGHRTTCIKRQDLERLVGEDGTARPRSWVFRGLGAGTQDGAEAAPCADWRAMGASEHFVQFLRGGRVPPGCGRRLH